MIRDAGCSQCREDIFAKWTTVHKNTEEWPPFLMFNDICTIIASEFALFSSCQEYS